MVDPVNPGRLSLYRADDAPTSNAQVASSLREVANLLETQQANPFRVQAYRRAAAIVDELGQPVATILAEHGMEGLDQLPGIGRGLAAAIRELVLTHQLSLLERLRGESDPEAMLAAIPGIGPRLARRLHTELDIDSLEALEAAVLEGRLQELEGIGEKRLRAVWQALAGRFASQRRVPGRPPPPPPPVAELLDVDREYRERAGGEELPRIAPRRSNPGGAPWLPVLHTERGPRHYTALYSNSPRAHALGRTDDWVVIYSDGEAGERQCTVVTETRGAWRGHRVVRGREAECATYRSGTPGSASAP